MCHPRGRLYYYIDKVVQIKHSKLYCHADEDNNILLCRKVVLIK